MANRIKGITIEIDGKADGLQNALKAVNADLRSTQNALKDVDKLLKFNPGNADLIRQKQEYLKQAIEDTEKKLKEEKAALEQLKDAGDTEHGQEQQRALTREIIETENSLKSLKQEAREYSSVLGKQMQVAGDKIKGVGQSIQGVGRSMSMYVTAPIVGIGTAAVTTTAEFDKSMSKVQAISGATGDDFQALRDKAREMGATTKFTASESADALNYMAMAGWKTEEMLVGIEGVMNLAAASGEDLARTSDIVTDALTAFKRPASDAGRLADIMAEAAANANTNVDMMGETFKYAAPVAGSLGFSMEDTAIATGLMANAGIKASQAGTSLRSGFVNLVKPTEQMAEYMKKYNIEVSNSDGTMKSLREIMIQLRTNLGGVAEAEQAAAVAAIFGKRAMSGWLAIINASDEDFNQLTTAIDNSEGAAKRMADVMQDNLAGQLTILKSQLQEAAISLGDALVPTIRKAVKWVQEMVDKFNALDDETKENIVKFGLLLAAIGPVLTAIGTMTMGVGSLVGGLGKVITKVSGFSTAIAGVPFAPLLGGLSALVGGFAFVEAGLHATRESVRNHNQELYTAIDAANDTADALEKAGGTMKTAFDNANESLATAGASADLARVLVDQLEALSGTADKSDEELLAMKAAVDELNVLFPDLQLSINGTTGELSKSTDELREWIDTQEKALMAKAYQEVIREETEAVTAAQIELIKSEKALNDLRNESVSYEEGYAEALRKHDEIIASLTGNEVDYADKLAEAEMVLQQFTMQHNDAAEAEKNLLDHQAGLKDQITDGINAINSYKEELAGFETQTEAAEESTQTFDEAVEETTTLLDDLGNQVDETTGEIVEFADAATEAYVTAFEEARESIEGQLGLFDQLEEKSATAFDTINENLSANTSTYEQWTKDLELLWDYAIRNGDASTRALVQQLAGLGVDGAAEVRNFADAVESGNDDVVQSISNAANELSHVKDRSARIQAQILSDTVLTTEGVVSAADAAGIGLVESVDATGDAVNRQWSGDMGSLSGYTEDAMSDVEDELDSGMDDAERSIANAEGKIDSAAENTFGAARLRAISSANGIGGEGERAIREFEDGMWGKANNLANSAEAVAGYAGGPFADLGSSGYNWGSELGGQFADGIRSQWSNVAFAANDLAYAAAEYLHFSTPDKGPLRHSDKWGGEFADLFAEGMLSGVGEVETAAEALAGAAALQAPYGAVDSFGGSAANNSRVFNLDVTVNAAPGMDEMALTERVIDRINFEVAQEEAVYA